MHFVWEGGPVFPPFWNFIPLLFFLYYLSLKLLYALRGSLSNYPPYSLTVLTYFQTFVSLCHVSGELPGIYVSVIFMTISGLAYIQSTSFLSLFFLTSGQGLHFVFPRFQMNSFPYRSFLKVPFYFFFTIKKKILFLSFKKKIGPQHVGSQFPDQGWNPHPLHWEDSILIAGLPGKSLFFNSYIFHTIHSFSHLKALNILI